MPCSSSSFRIQYLIDERKMLRSYINCIHQVLNKYFEHSDVLRVGLVEDVYQVSLKLIWFPECYFY
jgi:hypothetical protein